jgi:Ser/Thr protein kinase RdoA (MazF antagonist)
MDPDIAALLSRTQIEEAASRWSEPTSLVMIEDVENLVYDYHSKGDRWVLRLVHSSHRLEDDVIAEIDFVLYLLDGGVRAARPVPSKRGHLTEIVSVGDSYFVASVFDRAPGRWALEITDLHRDEAIVRNWGRTAGRMHALSKNYDASRLKKRRPAWNPAYLEAQAREHVPIDEVWLAEGLEEILARVRDLPQNSEGYGLIHNDLNVGNFFIDEGGITVFDFDDSCYNWFIVDIASAVPLYSSMFHSSGWEEPLIEFFNSFVLGYLEENHLDARWFDHLGEFLRLSVLDSAVFSFMLDEKNRTTWDSWFTKVLSFARDGHPLFKFDFRGIYDSVIIQGESR